VLWHWAAVSKFKAISSFSTLNEFTVVLQGEFTHWITEVSKKPSNSFDQGCLRVKHPIFPPYPAIATALLSLPPGSSMPIDSHSEGSLAEKQVYYVTGRNLPKEADVRSPFAQ
jgi:hypothetical protein